MKQKSQSCDLNTITSAKTLLTTLLFPTLTPPTGSVFIDIVALVCYICDENTTLQNFRRQHTDSNITVLYQQSFWTSCSINDLNHFCSRSVIARVGFRSSALLAMLLSNESASDSELCPVSPESSQETSTATDASSLPGSTAAICSPSSPKSKVREKITGSSKSQHGITILNKKSCLWKVLLLLLLWSFFQKFKSSRVGHSFAKIQSTYVLTCWVFFFFFCIVYQ